VASAVDIGRSSGSPSASAPPSPHPNAVAHEARVVVTGARPSDNPRNRELFAEDTTSVLVFENGGVIRLSAAVVPGQLLFLTNQDTKREVIAQVTRKRVHRPTSCYVELEFTQPSPKFWGIELPKTPQPPPPDSPHAEVAKLVHSAEATADDPGTPAPAPSANEVDELVKEVEALRAQLKSLQEKQPAANIPPPPPAPAAVAASTPTSVPAETCAAAPTPSVEVQPAKVQPAEPPHTVTPPVAAVPVAALSPAPPRPHTTAESQFSEDDLLPRPALDFQKASVVPKPSSRAQKKIFAPPKSGAPRALFLSATLIFVAAGAAWYMDWIPGLPPLRTPPSRTNANLIPPENPAHAPSPAPQKPVQSPATSSDAAQPSAAASATQAAAPALNSSSSVTPPADAAPPAASAAQLASVAAAAPVSNAKGKSAPLLSASKRTPLRTSTDSVPASTTLLLEGGPIVPPKLVKSVRPNAPPDAILGYVTGDVAVDAAVDPSGRVNSVKVLSGPASLHKAAVNAVKQYRYEPATQNGKPVSAHVNVTIQFWFEP
jgi:periplasmic protein TonB